MKKQTGYLILLIVLIASHVLLSGYIQIILWIITGITFFQFFPTKPRVWGMVLLFEFLIGAGFYLLRWRGESNLYYVSNHSDFSASTWVTIVILLNALTAMFCVGVPFTLCRLIFSKRQNHTL